VGEDLELGCDPHVVSVGRNAIGDDTRARLVFRERLDHAALGGHTPDPAIGFDGHGAGNISVASTLTPLDSVDKPRVPGYVSTGQVNFFTNSHEPALSLLPPLARLRGVQRGTVDRAFAPPRPPQAHPP